MGDLKAAAPRRLKDLANHSTRAYGVATARWRPYPDFRGDRWYRSHFHSTAYRRWKERRLGPVVTGEASPYYMYGPHLPALIARRMPDVRLIMLLRDPVARAYGHYQERVQQGVEHLSFEAALAAEPARPDGEWERMLADPGYYSRAHGFFSYRGRGVYLPQLLRIFACFPRDRVLIIRSEDLYVAQNAVFDTVCRFLGVAPAPVVRPARHNYIARSPIAPATRRELAAFYAPHNEALYRYLDRDFGWVGDRSG